MRPNLNIQNKSRLKAEANVLMRARTELDQWAAQSFLNAAALCQRGADRFRAECRR